MKKLTIALAALALGAGAMYYLDPAAGRKRRAEAGMQLERGGRALLAAAQGGSRSLAERVGGWMAAMRGRFGLGARSADPMASVPDEDGLEPLSMTPPGLEDAEPHARHHSLLIPALAVAAPVAVAVGAAAVLRKREDGHWIH